jgi:hypothetical protein
MKFSLWIACAYMALTVPFGFGQLWGISGSAYPGPAPGEYTFSYTVSRPTITRRILQGRPYSGEEISQKANTLFGGTLALEPGSSTITYRDSAGRVRTERHATRPMGLTSWVAAPVVPEICDPVAGYNYYLDTVNRIAYRMALPRESVLILQALPKETYTAVITKEKNVTRTNEPLGTKMLEGIEVQGVRITTTYDAGAVGNDRPITATTEFWRSFDLDITVLSKTSDPRTGDFTNAVINISRTEPNPALFQIPPGYKVVDEQTVPFTFAISSTGSSK